VLQRRGVKELGGLLVLFVLLIGFAAFYEQVGQERVASNAPTTLNTHAEGVRALYLLFVREGIRTEALKTPWSDLGADDGLLVFVEPPASDRPLDRDDIKVLEKWIRAGGTLLDMVADPPVEQPLDPSNTVTGDCGATAGSPQPHDVAVAASTASPLLRGVQSLSVSSRQRLTLATHAAYTVLARDSEGVVAVEKPLGKGRVILVANRYAATNAGISQADNSVFLVNVARLAATQSKRIVRFDEYHHGVGFAQKTAAVGGLWANIPLPWRLGCLHLLAAGLLLLYNGNRRFGPARVISPISMRASTDYVNSMARLYRRAGAADIAVETLYLRFLRDLHRALDLPSDTGVAQIARIAQQKFGPPADGLLQLLLRGEAIVAGQRLLEPDMLNLARQIEHFRRICELVGV
jgi:hypothetical protein